MTYAKKLLEGHTSRTVVFLAERSPSTPPGLCFKSRPAIKIPKNALFMRLFKKSHDF